MPNDLSVYTSMKIRLTLNMRSMAICERILGLCSQPWNTLCYITESILEICELVDARFVHRYHAEWLS